MSTVYCHFESDDCQYTAKLKTDQPLSEALAAFAKKYHKKHPEAARLGALEARSEGLVLADASWAALANKSDVFVTRCETAPKPPTTAAPSPPKPPPPSKAPPPAPAPPKPPKATAPPPKPAAEKPKPKAELPQLTSAESAEASKLVKRLLKKADAQAAGKAYRTARQLYEAILEAAPASREASRGLASIALESGDHEAAAGQFADLYDATKESRDAYSLGRCHAASGRYALATNAFRKALRAHGAAQAEFVEERQITVALARALLNDGDQEEALTLTEKVLATDENYAPAVVSYAAIARDMGTKAEEELALLLRAVVADQQHGEARKRLSEALGAPRGVDRLRKQLGDGGQSAAAVAFLATICKDHGYVEVAAELLAWALEEKPNSASYALNLVHAHEILNDYDSALKVATAFLARKRKKRVGKQGVAYATCLEVLEGAGPFGSDFFLSGYYATNSKLRWVEPAGGSAKAPSQSFATTAAEGDDPEPPVAPPEQFSDDDLDALALLFAAVKILYLGGAVARAQTLVAAIEPTRRAAAKPLHETTIRNEHAYYCCVAQILAVDPRSAPPAYPAAAPEAGAAPPVVDVYVCGDSHALAPAWKQLSGGRVRLRPALVTGLKHWHLRAASAFYPKRNFYSVVGLDAATCSSSKVAKSLGLFPGARASKKAARPLAATVPPGATVLFVLGEIDCREGILVAVEKLRYADVTEGIRKTAKIFVDTAAALCAEKKYARGLVHPVPPVLDETRGMVTQYNAILKDLVDANEFLTYLDFFDDFLDKDKLKPEYALDGTHLHPRYLDDLLAPALDAVLGDSP